MKEFTIAKNILHIYNTHIPKNACYGKFTAVYGMRQVTYTKGSNTYTTTRHDAKTATIIYYADDFEPFLFRGHLHYYIHVWDSQRETWHEVKTSENPKYYGLANFLAEKFEEYNIKPSTKCEYYISRDILPRERKPQKYTPCDANPNSYALSGNTIDSFLSPCTFEKYKKNNVQKFNGDTTKKKPKYTGKLDETKFHRTPCEERPDPWANLGW